MQTYYNQQTNEKVEAKKVSELCETFTNSEGEVTVTKDNYIVSFPAGHKIGVAAADFNIFYAKTPNKLLPDQE